MTSATDRTRAKLLRADRARLVRDALGYTQDQMADALNGAAKRLGVGGAYDKHKVSRIESAGRDLSAADAVVWAELDPERRGVPWLIAGLPRETGKRPPSSSKREREA